MTYICLFKLDTEGNEVAIIKDYYGRLFIISEEDVKANSWTLTILKKSAAAIVGVGNYVAKKVSVNELGTYVS